MYEWKLPPVLSVNKECCVLKATALQTLKMSTKGHRWKEGAEATPSGVHPEEMLGETAQGTGFQEQRCISKQWFQWAQTLHPPKHRKALDSLTSDVWFSLINNNLLMFWLPDVFLQNSYISWLPAPTPHLLLNSFSALSKMLCLRLEILRISTE